MPAVKNIKLFEAEQCFMDKEYDVKDVGKKLSIGTFLISLFLIGILWFARPLFQRLVYRTTIASPITVIFFIPAIALYFLGNYKKAGWLKPAGILLIVVGMVFSMASFFPGQFALLDTVKAENITSLPETGTSRIVPREVAFQYAYNTLQEPRYTLSDVDDITVMNGTAYWSFGLVPDTFIERYFGNQKGSVYVDMANSSRTPVRIDGNMKYGMGMQVTDNVFWKVAKEKFFAGYKDPFMVTYKGDNYIAYPYVFHNWVFKYFIPVAVPEFRGVVLVDEEGNIKDLSREEAMESKVLENQNFYPYDLARRRVESMNMKNGIFNYLFRKKDVFEIPDNGLVNQQPFSVLTDEGMKYFVAVEPYGNAGGIYRIFVIDGRTGNISTYKTQKTLYGPERARDLVKSHDELSRISWGSFKTSEPIPAVKNGDLYWQIKIVARDNSDVSRVVYVNSKTKEVIPFTARKSRSFYKVEDVGGNRTDVELVNSSSEGSKIDKRIILRRNGEVVGNYSLEDYALEIK